MNQHIVGKNTDRNGRDLVVEFLCDENSRFAPGVPARMLKYISETYHCLPEQLDITDIEADDLITNKLYPIACQDDLEIAKMPARDPSLR